MKKSYYLILLLIFSSCISLKPPKMHLTGKQTVIESQVVGDYQEIESDAWAISSEKTNVQKESAGSSSGVGDEEMFEAMKIREYHADKVREYKNEGAIGESNVGYLEYRSLEKYESDKDQKKILAILIKEENKARKTIFYRTIVLSGKSNPTPYDIETFGKKFAEEQIDLAFENDWIQNTSGSWFKKK